MKTAVDRRRPRQHGHCNWPLKRGLDKLFIEAPTMRIHAEEVLMFLFPAGMFAVF